MNMERCLPEAWIVPVSDANSIIKERCLHLSPGLGYVAVRFLMHFYNKE